MRFKNYMSEMVTDVDFENIVTTLKKNCGPFINDLKNIKRTIRVPMLLSGRELDGNFVLKNVRSDREPKDTPVEIHNWIDAWFYKKFGVKARSASVFASFSSIIADSYGSSTYVIFPVGSYKAISSKNVDDLFSEIVEPLYEAQIGRSIGHSLRNLDDEDKQRLKDSIYFALDRANYINILTLHSNEYMIVCKKYYLINRKYAIHLSEYFKGEQ